MWPEEKLDSIVSAKGSYHVKCLSLLVIGLLVALGYFYSRNLAVGIIVVSLIGYFVICYICYARREKIGIHDLKKRAKSGDLIFFKTSGSYDIPEFIYYRLVPTLWKLNDWSHIGMIVKDPETDKLYIWESAEDPSFDHLTNKMVSGVKLVNLFDKICKYNGYVGYKPLKEDLSTELKETLHKRCTELANTPFKKNLFSDNELNCVEAVKKVLKETDIVSINAITPGDFSKNNSLWRDPMIVLK